MCCFPKTNRVVVFFFLCAIVVSNLLIKGGGQLQNELYQYPKTQRRIHSFAFCTIYNSK